MEVQSASSAALEVKGFTLVNVPASTYFMFPLLLSFGNPEISTADM